MIAATQSRWTDSVSPGRAKGADRVLLLLLSLMVVICETPYLTRNLNPAVFGGLMALFAARSACCPKASNIFARKALVPVVVYVLLELFYKILGISSAGLGYYFATYKFLFVFLAMACVGSSLSRHQQIGLCCLSVGGMLVNMADNIRIWLRIGPAAYVVYFLREGGIMTNTADTAFSTAVMLLMGAMFLVALHAKRVRLQILAWGIVVFCAYVLVFVMQRGTTFFLGFAMLVAIALAPGSNSGHLTLKTALAPLLLVFVGWLLWGGGLEAFLTWLASVLDGQRLQSRVLHVLRLLQSGSMETSGGSLSSRYALILTSLGTFTESLKSFFLGVGDHRISVHSVNLQIGNHSQFLDTFARYGVAGGLCFVGLLASLQKEMGRIARLPPGHFLHAQMLVLYFFFVLRTLWGTTLIGSVATQLFVTIPLTVSLLATRHNAAPGVHADPFGPGFPEICPSVK